MRRRDDDARRRSPASGRWLPRDERARANFIRRRCLTHDNRHAVDAIRTLHKPRTLSDTQYRLCLLSTAHPDSAWSVSTSRRTARTTRALSERGRHHANRRTRLENAKGSHLHNHRHQKDKGKGLAASLVAALLVLLSLRHEAPRDCIPTRYLYPSACSGTHDAMTLPLRISWNGGKRMRRW